MSVSEPRYTTVAIVLHWLVAALVVLAFAWGWSMQAIPKDPPGLRAGAFNLHKSIGLTLFVLMTLRLAWRLLHPPPPLPAMPAWQRRVARGNHLVLYALLLLMPLAGYLGSVFSGYPVRYFGLMLPAWGWKSEAIKSAMSVAHLTLSWLLAAAVVLHVGAAVKHALVDRDHVMARMKPRRSAPLTARNPPVADAGP